jgi:hypothetical protein
MTQLKNMKDAPKDGKRILAFSSHLKEWHIVNWDSPQPFSYDRNGKKLNGWVTDAHGPNPDNYWFDDESDLVGWIPLPPIPKD